VISKKAIRLSLRHIFERRDCLDDVELDQMTDFALTEVMRNFSHRDPEKEADDEGGVYNATMSAVFDGLTRFVSNLKEACGALKRPTDHGCDSIDVDGFVASCSSIEPISFESLVQLFDRDRKISCVERFFMPIHFKTSLAEIRGRDGESAKTAGSRASTKSHMLRVQNSM